MWADKQVRKILMMMVFISGLAAVVSVISVNEEVNAIRYASKIAEPESTLLKEVQQGIHLPTGLIADTDFELVVYNCTSCHSAELIVKNRLSSDGWIKAIRWMQEKQNLWDLGKNEERIVAYLAKNYASTAQGRRKVLSIQPDEWYELKN